MSPIYEYECPNGHITEKLKPMEYRHIPVLCHCQRLAALIISRTHWFMGWKFLKDNSEKTPAAPTDSGSHPAWDEAYQGPQVKPKASPL